MTHQGRPALTVSPEPPDETLLPRLRAGEASAWHEAFSRLWPRAHRLAERVLHDRHLAEDAAADVLRRLAGEPHRVRSWPEVEAFVFVSTRRRALSMLRAARTAKRGAGTVIALEDAQTDAIPVSTVCTAALDLASLLPRLDPLRQQIVRAHFLHGQTSEEIGRELALNPATVRSHVLRALQQLRRDLPEATQDTDSRATAL